MSIVRTFSSIIKKLKPSKEIEKEAFKKQTDALNKSTVYDFTRLNDSFEGIKSKKPKSADDMIPFDPAAMKWIQQMRSYSSHMKNK